jgi:hypothetical protein
MKELIERFYDSIRAGGALPIPYREIILTARIMDEIFAQIYPNRTKEDGRPKTEDRAQMSGSSCESVLNPASSVL